MGITMKITEYKDEYFNDINHFNLSDYASECFQDLIEEKKNYALVAIEQNNIMGIAIAQIDDDESDIFLYVDKTYRNNGVGTALLLEIEKYLKTKEIKHISLDYPVNAENKCFFKKHNYVIDFTSELMYYKGPFSSKPSKYTIRSYNDEDYMESRTIIFDAFHKMQVEVGLDAEDFTYPPNEEQRISFLENKENMYLLIDDSKIVGVLIIDGNEIDEIAVPPNLQRLGYGRELLYFGMNKILNENGENTIALWCIVGNSAKEFYIKEGFEPCCIYDIVNKKI